MKLPASHSYGGPLMPGAHLDKILPLGLVHGALLPQGTLM